MKPHGEQLTTPIQIFQQSILAAIKSNQIKLQ